MLNMPYIYQRRKLNVTCLVQKISRQVEPCIAPGFSVDVGSLISFDDFLEEVFCKLEEFFFVDHFELIFEFIEFGLHLVEIADHGGEDFPVPLFVHDGVGQVDIVQDDQQVVVKFFLFLVELTGVEIVSLGAWQSIFGAFGGCIVDRETGGALGLHPGLGLGLNLFFLEVGGGFGLREIDPLGEDDVEVPVEVREQILLVFEEQFPELDESQGLLCC